MGLTHRQTVSAVAHAVVTGSALALTLSLAGGCGNKPPADPFGVGIRALQKGRYAAAAKHLELAAQKQPDNPSVHCHLGIAYWKQGHFDLAAGAFKRAASFSKTDPRPFEFLGNTYMELGRWIEAKDAFSKAYERAPKSPRVLTELALVQVRTGSPEAAKTYLTLALGADPLYEPALFDLAVLNRDWLQNNEEARKYFLKYLDIETDHCRTREARRALKELSAPGARPDSRGTASSPAPISGVSPLASGTTDALLAPARAAIQSENYDEALMRLKEVVAKNPRNADALWELAQLYDKHLENPDLAARTYQDFLRLFPSDRRAPAAKQGLEKLAPARRSGGVSDAGGLPTLSPPPALHLRKAEKPDSRLAMNAFDRAQAYQKTSDWDRAIYHYKRAIENDTSFLDAYFNLGQVYRASGNLAGARDAFLCALQLKPDMTRAKCVLAMVYRDLRQKPQAISELNSTLKMDPNFADAHLLLGQIYQDDPANAELARKHFARYVELAPTGSGARPARDWLSLHAHR